MALDNRRNLIRDPRVGTIDSWSMRFHHATRTAIPVAVPALVPHALTDPESGK